MTEKDLTLHLFQRKFYRFRNVIFGEGVVYFKLWNLSGKLVGFQRYKPFGEKYSGSKRQKENTKKDNKLRYLTYCSEGEIGVYGLETYNPDKPLLISEGIFDINMFHNIGLSGISVLTNNPEHARQFIKLLPNRKIAILDNEPSSFLMRNYCDDYVLPPKEFTDFNEMSLDRFFLFAKNNKILP